MKTTKMILLMLSLFLFSNCGDTKVDEISQDYIPVKTFKIQKNKRANIITTSGLLTTENESKLSFKIGGVLDKTFVNEGESFKKGQLLAILNLTEINAQVMQAKLNFEKSERDFARISNLFKDSVASLEQLQNTKTQLEASEKALDQAKFNQKYASIYATSDGFVSKKLANEGEILQPGFPVFLINEKAKQSSWIVKVGVSESEWELINLKDKCKILISNKTMSGVVLRKSQAIDSQSGAFLIEIKLQFEATPLAVGMFAKVEIYSSKLKENTAIPYDALIEANGNKAFVFTPLTDSTVQKIPILISNFNDNEVNVLEGLDQISSVIIGNSAFLNENSKIKIIK